VIVSKWKSLHATWILPQPTWNMHNIVNYTLASQQLQIYAKATALTYVVEPPLHIVPDNQYSTFLDRTVPLTVYGKPGTRFYITASAIVWQGNLMQHWVIAIMGRFPKSGTQSSIRLQTWSISGRITKWESMNGMGAATNNSVTSDHIHPNYLSVAAYLSLECFNLVIFSSLAMWSGPKPLLPLVQFTPRNHRECTMQFTHQSPLQL
jgi:hypothetical protein